MFVDFEQLRQLISQLMFNITTHQVRCSASCSSNQVGNECGGECGGACSREIAGSALSTDV